MCTITMMLYLYIEFFLSVDNADLIQIRLE